MLQERINKSGLPVNHRSRREGARARHLSWYLSDHLADDCLRKPKGSDFRRSDGGAAVEAYVDILMWAHFFDTV